MDSRWTDRARARFPNVSKLFGVTPLVTVPLVVASLGLTVAATPVQAQKGGSVTIAITEEPDTLDPQKTSTAITARILRYAADTLVTKDFSGDYIPAVASSWDVSSNGLTWTFVLKPGVKFHNGSPVDADAVRDSFRRALDPDTRSPIAGSLLGPVEAIESVGERTVRISLSEPFAPLLDNLTDPRAAVVDVEAARAKGSDFGRKPVLTGAWKVAEWRSGDRIVLRRNAAYDWGPEYAHEGAPYLEEIVFRVIPEATTQVAALESGEVDVVNTVTAAHVKRLQDSGRYKMPSFLRNGVGLFMEFNVEKPPFDDVRVRRAMNYAINKGIVLQLAIRGLGEIAHGPLPPSISGYWEGIEEYGPQYDPERALALLEQAGWTRGPDGVLQKNGEPFRFTLSTQATDTWMRSAQVVQAQLKELGIRMDIETFEFGTLLQRLKEGRHQADFMGYTYTSPDIFYVWFHSSNIGTGLANSHFRDEKLDNLIEASRLATDTEERFDIYAELQRYIVDQALWVPLWINNTYMAIRPEVKDTEVHPDGFLVLLDAYVE